LGGPTDRPARRIREDFVAATAVGSRDAPEPVKAYAGRSCMSAKYAKQTALGAWQRYAIVDISYREKTGLL
jgi:hypothetical protein